MSCFLSLVSVIRWCCVTIATSAACIYHVHSLELPIVKVDKADSASHASPVLAPYAIQGTISQGKAEAPEVKPIC